MQIEVVFLPPIITEIQSKVCVVIDVLRATSTLVQMFESGVDRVTLAESPEAALATAAESSGRPLVCGESGGLPPTGFDRGNSPREFQAGELDGMELVFCTSNGTRAMRTVAGAPVVLAGSLLNAAAVARQAASEARKRSLGVTLVCSGDFLGTRFAIDDAYCAGFLAKLIEKEARGVGPGASGGSAASAATLDESAIAAVRLFESYSRLANRDGAPVRTEVLEAFWESHNARVLESVGLAEDVEFCAQLNISRIVPRLRAEGERLTLVSEPAPVGKRDRD